MQTSDEPTGDSITDVRCLIKWLELQECVGVDI